MAYDLASLGITGTTISSFGTQALFISMYAAFAVFAGFCIYIMYLYKDRAEILEMRAGDVYKVSTDWVRKVKDQNGVLRLKLLLKKEEFPPPRESDTIYLKGRKDLYKLYRTVSGEYIHCSVDSIGNIKIVDPDVNLWTGLMLQEKAEKYDKNDWFTRHQTLILGLSGLVFVLMVVYFALQHIDGIVSHIDGVAANLGEIAERLGDFGQQKLDSFPR